METAEDYEKAKNKAILSDLGYRELSVEGQAENEHTVVDASSPHTSTGKSQVVLSDVGILFGVPSSPKLNRPRKPSGYEYVAVDWQQGNHHHLEVRIVDRDSKRAFEPYDCVEPFSTFHDCEYLVPRTALTSRAALLFEERSTAPGLIRLDSLARENFASLRLKYRGMKGEPVSGEDLESLRRLNQIDPTIPRELTPSP